MGLFTAHGLALGVLFSLGYRLNITDSMPVGVWRVQADAMPARGDAAWACPPLHESVRFAVKVGYLRPGFCPGGVVPVLKTVVALPGDHIAVSKAGVVVNHNLLPASAPLPFAPGIIPRAVEGEGTVKPGEAWLVSTYNPRSYDSRYFGPVPLKNIVGRAAPVFVQEKPHD
ncbi:conjugative transfer signal peptidase TraF (plasmid) [Brevundimonas olei]|uniref:Conjugative transfer signal peptidase TraF n=1 Tax=Brevundimonas olei TaxID=657642 RepID=A0ABZ2IKE0_9CAUL